MKDIIEMILRRALGCNNKLEMTKEILNEIKKIYE